MRRLIVSMITSLDGYHEGPGHDVLTLPFDQGFSAYNLQRLRAAETLLLGRTSFEGFRDYWPQVADDTAQDPSEREISRRNHAIDKIVVSDSLTPQHTEPWQATTRIVPRADAVATAAELRSGDGGDILVFGSCTMWNQLLMAGQVDELHVMVGPALLGAGTPVYTGPKTVPLKLLESRILDRSSLILARYAPTPT
jgi:dihydrofolate reductase